MPPIPPPTKVKIYVCVDLPLDHEPGEPAKALAARAAAHPAYNALDLDQPTTHSWSPITYQGRDARDEIRNGLVVRLDVYEYAATLTIEITPPSSAPMHPTAKGGLFGGRLDPILSSDLRWLG